VKNNVSIGMGTCFACAVACKKEVKVDEPWVVDPDYGGPEYETLASLGSNCGVSDLKAICKANELCQRYSIDTISTGTTISFAMECFEHGLLTIQDTEGMDLSFGNAESMLKLVELIGEKRGLGELLAEGSKRAAEKIGNGAEEFAVHVKGQEVPMHDPRLKRGEALGYAISPTGADHVHNIHDTFLYPKLPKKYNSLGVLEPVPIEDFGPKKVRLYKYVGEWRTLNNFLVTCLFTPWSVIQKVSIVRSVTGWNVSAFELMKVVERGNTLARVFNLREGFTDKDDWLPPRFFKPRTSGNLRNVAVNAKDLQNAKLLYYDMMGWNENGIPKESALEELNIGWAADKIPVQ
jgi:aldehyde:ferredoxin oxidoreductase